MSPKLTLHQVVGIERHSNHTWIIIKEGRRDYDAVIIAAPYHSSHITLPADLSTLIPPQPYVHLHTTLLTTTAATPDPVYFGYKPGSKIASNIVTTFDGVSRDSRASEFNFISYQGQVKFTKNETHDGQETGERVVKISSMKRISDEWLAAMFQNQVGWVYRKEVCLCKPFSQPELFTKGTSSGPRILCCLQRQNSHRSGLMTGFSM